MPESNADEVQIMDPKMDSGCMLEGDEFEELYDVSQRLLPEEVLGIIDQLLCHEASLLRQLTPRPISALTSCYASRCHGMSGIRCRRQSLPVSMSNRCSCPTR